MDQFQFTQVYLGESHPSMRWNVRRILIYRNSISYGNDSESFADVKFEYILERKSAIDQKLAILPLLGTLF